MSRMWGGKCEKMHNWKTTMRVLKISKGTFHNCQVLDNESIHIEGVAVLEPEVWQQFLEKREMIINQYTYILCRNYPDIIKKRNPQNLYRKDCADIVSEFQLDEPFKKIHEAGTGNGFLTYYLAKSFPETIIETFEIVEKSYLYSKENLNQFNLMNINLNFGSIEDIKEPIEALFLDLPNPGEVLKTIRGNLMKGAVIQCFLPNINQVSELLMQLKEEVTHCHTRELIHREYQITNETCKPIYTSQHTGFLVRLIWVG